MKNTKFKKALLGAVAAVSAFVAPASMVSAAGLTDLSGEGQLKIHDQSEAMNFETVYNSECDFTEVNASIMVTEQSIAKILGQTSGLGADLSYYYFGVEPVELRGKTLQKNGVWIAKSSNPTCNDIKTTVDAAIQAENDKAADGDVSANPNTNTPMWPIGLVVQYLNSEENKWGLSEMPADSNKSIKANLMEKLKLEDESGLRYGQNFRFYSYTDWNYVIGYQEQNEDKDTTYVKVNYEVNFPISVDLGEGRVAYYPSLDLALDDETNKNIVVSEDLTVTDEVTIPSDTTLTVVDGKKISLDGENAKITFEEGGKFVGTTGSIVKGEESLVNTVKYIISVDGGLYDMKNGGAFAAGTEVTLEAPEEMEGYTLVDRRVTSSNGDAVVISDGKFTMPAGSVSVNDSYVSESNSSEGDNQEPETKEPEIGVADVEKFMEQVANDAKVKDLFAEGATITVYPSLYTVSNESVGMALGYQLQKDSSARKTYYDIVDEEGTKTFGVFSIGIYATDGFSPSKQVNELAEEVEFKIQLPEGMEEVAEGKMRKFYVVRLHDEADGTVSVDKIEAKYDEEGNYITFKSNKFSYYTGIYQDVDVPAAGDQGAFTAQGNGASAVVATLATLVGVVTSIVTFKKLYKKNN